MTTFNLKYILYPCDIIVVYIFFFFLLDPNEKPKKIASLSFGIEIVQINNEKAQMQYARWATHWFCWTKCAFDTCCVHNHGIASKCAILRAIGAGLHSANSRRTSRRTSDDSSSHGFFSHGLRFGLSYDVGHRGRGPLLRGVRPGDDQLQDSKRGAGRRHVLDADHRSQGVRQNRRREFARDRNAIGTGFRGRPAAPGSTDTQVPGHQQGLDPDPAVFRHESAGHRHVVSVRQHRTGPPVLHNGVRVPRRSDRAVHPVVRVPCPDCVDQIHRQTGHVRRTDRILPRSDQPYKCACRRSQRERENHQDRVHQFPERNFQVHQDLIDRTVRRHRGMENSQDDKCGQVQSAHIHQVVQQGRRAPAHLHDPGHGRVRIRQLVQSGRRSLDGKTQRQKIRPRAEQLVHRNRE